MTNPAEALEHARAQALEELAEAARAVFVAETNLSDALTAKQQAQHELERAMRVATGAANTLTKTRNAYAAKAQRLIEGSAGVPAEQEAPK